MFDFLTDRFPWLPDFIYLFLGLGLIAFMVYWVRSSKSVGRGFVIHVEPDDISFTGDFPAHMQATVADFLRHDVQAAGAYQVRGHWEQETVPPMLVIVVKGDSARPAEQRIRNFLKLNLKPPRGR